MKLKKPTKRKKVGESTLEKLRAQACFKRDKGCLMCGRTDTLAPSHIYPQGRYQRMKWDLSNVIALCYQHHIHWWHKNPLEASAWIKKTLPASRLAKLKKMSQNNNLPKPDLEKVKQEYLKIINYVRP